MSAFDKLRAGTFGDTVNVVPLQQQFRKYFDRVDSSPKENDFKLLDPLKFWNDEPNMRDLPYLHRIAMQVLPSQPTSGDVERINSLGGLTLPRRNRLLPKTVSAMISAGSFYASNVEQTKKTYQR